MDIGRPLDGDLVRVRDEGLAILGLGALALVGAGGADDRLIRPILAVAFGLDLPSIVLRRVILDGTYLPELPRPPRVPTVDPKDIIRKAIIWGTLYEGLLGWGLNAADVEAYNAWVDRAKAHADGIRGLSPNAGCAGIDVKLTSVFPGRPAAVRVRGHEHRRVVREGDGRQVGSCRGDRRESPDRRTGSAPWASSSPTATRRRCAGTGGGDPSPGHGGDADRVRDDVVARRGSGSGPEVRAARAGRSGRPLKPWPCPPLIRSRHWTMPSPNLFIGGPPVVRSFTAGRVEPGGKLTLSWNVAGHGVQVSIKPLAGASAWAKLPNALPPVPGQFPGFGSVDVVIPYDGVDDWDAEYELSAVNPCSTYPVTARARVEMREPAPLFGFADTHVHFVSHLAFGGYGVSGLPWPTDARPDPPRKGSSRRCRACGHELIGLEAGFPPHDQGGYPQFDGWPKHTTLAHQQAYVDSIRRAVRRRACASPCASPSTTSCSPTGSTEQLRRPAGDRTTCPPSTASSTPCATMVAFDRRAVRRARAAAGCRSPRHRPTRAGSSAPGQARDRARRRGRLPRRLAHPADARRRHDRRRIRARTDRDLVRTARRRSLRRGRAPHVPGARRQQRVRRCGAVRPQLRRRQPLPDRAGASTRTSAPTRTPGSTYRIEQDTFPGGFVGARCSSTTALSHHRDRRRWKARPSGESWAGPHTAGASIRSGPLIGARAPRSPS